VYGYTLALETLYLKKNRDELCQLLFKIELHFKKLFKIESTTQVHLLNFRNQKKCYFQIVHHLFIQKQKLLIGIKRRIDYLQQINLI
jgi:hypothetical protein